MPGCGTTRKRKKWPGSKKRTKAPTKAHASRRRSSIRFVGYFFRLLLLPQLLLLVVDWNPKKSATPHQDRAPFKLAQIDHLRIDRGKIKSVLLLLPAPPPPPPRRISKGGKFQILKTKCTTARRAKRRACCQEERRIQATSFCSMNKDRSALYLSLSDALVMKCVPMRSDCPPAPVAAEGLSRLDCP
jgi:hypothetical protein